MAILPAPPVAAWPYIAASSVIHVGYFALVAFAYRSADLGVAYPLTRGTAPPLTALLAFLLVGETLGLNQWLSIAAIAAGIVALSADALLRGGLTRNTAIAAFANAGVIVVYTLVDGLGARAAGSGPVYVAWMLAGTALCCWSGCSRRAARVSFAHSEKNGCSRSARADCRLPLMPLRFGP
jgi:multidrug transporter EmrE-like cation transporter